MTEKPKARLILGSSSANRLDLLERASLTPDVIKGADIDETPRKGELPASYCVRMALEKNAALADEFPDDFILTADTAIVIGRSIYGKAQDNAEQEKFLRLFSGRSHRVLTALAVRAPNGRVSHRLHVSRVTVKRLSETEIKDYIACGEWRGKAGYMLAGMFSRYVTRINGTYSGIIGLPLYETMQLLNGLGYKIDTGV
jgi:septum formation protein